MTPVVFINCKRQPFVWLIANGYQDLRNPHPQHAQVPSDVGTG